MRPEPCQAAAKDAHGSTHRCSKPDGHPMPHYSPNRTPRGDWCGIMWDRTDEAGFARVDPDRP